jgi:Concanavalin A-like lectin/glucanases superfamily
MSIAIGITLGAGITMGGGIGTGPTPTLVFSLDADTYDNAVTGTQQNVSGTSDNVGFFPYGWPAYSAIQPGWTCVQTGAVVTVVNAGALTITTVGTPFTSGDSYTFTSANTWYDSVANIPVILYNGVTLSSSGGNSLSFTTSSSQYGQSTTDLSTLSTWTIEAWHYYDGTNLGASPCIVTEVFPGTTSTINYALGSLNDATPNLQSGFYNGGWTGTPTGYTLTSGNWYQIVGTYDGYTSRLFVNNTLVEQSVGSGTPISSTGGIRLMRRWDYGEYWGGKLGIVNIYEGAMNSIIVSQNWNLNKARFGL